LFLYGLLVFLYFPVFLNFKVSSTVYYPPTYCPPEITTRIWTQDSHSYSTQCRQSRSLPLCL